MGNPVEFQRQCGSSCIGEPFKAETSDEMRLEQIPDSATIYIISNDPEWARNIELRVRACRSDLAPKSISMEDALTEFDVGKGATLSGYFSDSSDGEREEEKADWRGALAEGSAKRIRLDQETTVSTDLSGSSDVGTIGSSGESSPAGHISSAKNDLHGHPDRVSAV